MDTFVTPGCTADTTVARLTGGVIRPWRHAVAFLTLLPVGCASLDVLTDVQIDRVGLQVYEEVIAKHDVVTSGADYEMVQRVGRRIVQATGEDLPWQVKLLKADDTPNAISLPGGRIAIYTGLLPITENESGLAVVLGHEMAHAVLRHGARRMAEDPPLHAGFDACQAGLGLTEMCDEARLDVMSAFGVWEQTGPRLPFRDDHEAEADALGLRYAIRAGYDPWEAPRLWERMAKVSGSSPQWLGAHPTSATRAATLRALIPQLVAQEKGWQPKQQAADDPAKEQARGATRE